MLFDMDMHTYSDEEDELEEFWVQTVSEDLSKKAKKMTLEFQVADVKKPLISVKRIVEKILQRPYIVPPLKT